jgi:hypothetical protein
MAKASKARDHRANRLPAALGPEDYAVLAQNLEVVALPGRKVLYEPGETIEHAYFPHDAIISLIAVFADGGSVEMALFGGDLAVADGFSAPRIAWDASICCSRTSSWQTLALPHRPCDHRRPRSRRDHRGLLHRRSVLRVAWRRRRLALERGSAHPGVACTRAIAWAAVLMWNCSPVRSA